MKAIDLISVLREWKLPTWDEKAMQLALSDVLTQSNIVFERERKLVGGIIDFLAGSVGVECKIGSTYASVAEQLLRYAENPEVAEIILVTTIASHRKLDGTTLQGKPVIVHWISPFI